MALSVNEFNDLKAEVEKAQKEMERAKGSLSTVMDRLKKDFGCKSLWEAEQRLKILQGQRNSIQKTFDRKLAAYQKKYHQE